MPEYSIHPNDIMIKFSAPKDRVVRVTKKMHGKEDVYIHDRKHQLLVLLQEDPGYTVSQLSEKMQMSRKTIAEYLKNLKELGLIERIGTSRKGYWNVL